MNDRSSSFRKIVSLLLAVGILLSATQGHAQHGHCREDQRCCPGKSACTEGEEQGATSSDRVPPSESSTEEEAQGHCGGAHCYSCLGVPSGSESFPPRFSGEFVSLPPSATDSAVTSEIFRPPLA